MSFSQEQHRENLKAWSSSKYALSEGYPIPQWRRGIKWWVGGRTPKANRDPPYMLREARYAEQIPGENDILIVNRVPGSHSTVLRMARDYSIEWEWGEDILSDTVTAAVYNRETGKILVSDAGNNRLVEFDPATGDVTLELTDWGATGTMTNPRATYEFDAMPSNPFVSSYTGNIVGVDEEEHYAACLDRDGNVIEDYGTYGTRGDGLNLSDPIWIEGRRTGCLLCDEENFRILSRLDMSTDDAEGVLSWPDPGCARWAGGTVAIAGEFIPGAVVQSGTLRMLPMRGQTVGITNNLTYLIRSAGDIYEWDSRASKQFLTSIKHPYLFDISLDANASTRKFSIPCFGHSKAKIMALSDQAADLNLYILKGRGQTRVNPIEGEPDADNNLQWISYDTVSLTANELEDYALPSPAGMMACEVVMGSTAGTVSLFGHLEP